VLSGVFSIISWGGFKIVYKSYDKAYLIVSSYH